jgi:hypothetical protein
MGFKAVTKDQNGQKVLMGFVPEEAKRIVGAELHNFVVPTKACPEPSKEVLDFIAANSNRNFDLHKVVGNEIVCRTISELIESEWMDWDYNYSNLPSLATEE